jgi:hypothetical protein
MKTITLYYSILNYTKLCSLGWFYEYYYIMLCEAKIFSLDYLFCKRLHGTALTELCSRLFDSCTLLHHTILCNITLFCTELRSLHCLFHGHHHTILYHTELCSLYPCFPNTTIPYYTALYYNVLNSNLSTVCFTNTTALCYTQLCSLYSCSPNTATPYYTVLY